MKSARRIAYVERKNKKPLPFLWKSLLFPIILLSIIVLLFVITKLDTKYWNGRDKLSFVFRDPNGSVGVTILDPKTSELTTLYIPGDTEVDVAMNYGTLRLKNVWQLGINEKKDGSLLAKTVTKNFLFPTFLWSDSDASSIQKSETLGILKFIFFPQKTNIPFGDRVSIALFSFKIKSLDESVIDLAKSQFLSKQILNDGDKGYRLMGGVSARLTAYFSDNDMASRDVNVYIVDSTGSYNTAQNVGQVVEAMGGKVVSIDKSAGSSDFVCNVLGKDSKIVKKISNIFNCKIITGKTDFDLEIRLGTGFAKTF